MCASMYKKTCLLLMLDCCVYVLLWGTDMPSGTTYIQAAMENLPLPDSSLDVIVCVYCFHEMPESARLASAKEWFR